MNRWPGTLVLHTVTVGAAIMVVAPLVWMVIASLMPPGTAQVYPPRVVWNDLSPSNYVELFTRLDMARFVLNSLFISASVTGFALLFNGLAGYGFAKLRFRGRDWIFRLLVMGLLIPTQVAMLPLFLLMRQMGLINTAWAIVIPMAASIYGIFLVWQYALSIPDSLLDAARMDGAGEWQIFFAIVLPVIRPILFALGIFTFLATWNDFLWPLIVLTDNEMYTLPVALAILSREHVQDAELMMAGAVVTVLPVLLLFLVCQKHLMGGIVLGSVKG